MGFNELPLLGFAEHLFLLYIEKLTMTKTNVSSSQGAPFGKSAGLAISKPQVRLGIEFEALMARASYIIPRHMNIQDLCSKHERKAFPFFCGFSLYLPWWFLFAI